MEEVGGICIGIILRYTIRAKIVIKGENVRTKEEK